MGEQEVIIVKKVKKVVHGGAHGGGSWKVAYADFVTALMAFFLLLWLVSMVAPEKRARVSQYFREYSMFEEGGKSILNLEEPLKIQMATPDGQQNSGQAREYNKERAGDGFQERFIDELKREIESKLADVRDQILIQRLENAVRVEVVDREGSAMFPLSSPSLTPEGKKVLDVISRTLLAESHPIAVEGHTDARVFASQSYSNWELSTARASAARLEMERAGLPPERLIRVSGFASTRPLVPEDPMDPRNRRISILVFKQPSRPDILPELGSHPIWDKQSDIWKND
jgi:chemotaxis protein MotB